MSWYFPAGEEFGNVIGEIVAIVIEQVIIRSFKRCLRQVADMRIKVVVRNCRAALSAVEKRRIRLKNVQINTRYHRTEKDIQIRMYK